MLYGSAIVGGPLLPCAPFAIAPLGGMLRCELRTYQSREVVARCRRESEGGRPSRRPRLTPVGVCELAADVLAELPVAPEQLGVDGLVSTTPRDLDQREHFVDLRPSRRAAAWPDYALLAGLLGAHDCLSTEK